MHSYQMGQTASDEVRAVVGFVYYIGAHDKPMFVISDFVRRSLTLPFASNIPNASPEGFSPPRSPGPHGSHCVPSHPLSYLPAQSLFNRFLKLSALSQLFRHGHHRAALGFPLIDLVTLA